MSRHSTTTAETARGGDEILAVDWGRVGRQIAGILRLELRKNLLSGRAMAVYLLGFGPVLLALVWAGFTVAYAETGDMTPQSVVGAFAAFYPLYVRLSIFLGALFLFTNLFRAEVLERTLHYYLLSPIRREVLVLGKYLAALVACAAVFTVGTLLIFLLMLAPFGSTGLFTYLLHGPGLGNLLAYAGISALAVAGYGAVFLLVGQFFRNPILPALALWLWEMASFLMPPLLKKFSVVHYLRSLYPIPVTDGPFAVMASPTPWWLSLPGLVLFTAAVLAVASWRARRMEIDYGGE